jgi:uncharacterized protein YbjT (DUF2867 family)
MMDRRDQLVTLFGGSGFIGRYVAQELLRSGARVRIAARDPRRGWFLKPLGGLGQTQFVTANPRRPATVAAAVAGADAVINLIGVLAGDFEAAHVTAPRVIAEAVAGAKVGALVQISAIGADPASPSRYGQSKAAGEAAVRGAFPGATIIRPSVVFGPEDQFVNRFAGMVRMMPVLPVIRGAAKFQPIYVVDLARAIAAAALDPAAHGGKTVELGGPEVVTMSALMERIMAWTGHRRPILSVPDIAGDALSRLGFLPGAPITRDQWQMMLRDNVVSDGGEGLAAFGIEPTPMGAVAPDWLIPYRRHGRFSKLNAA